MKNKTQSWTVLDRRELYRADPWVTLSVEHLRLPNGQEVEDFHQLKLPDFVAVVALTQNQQVLMLRQYKHGARRTSLTLPGGLVESGEAPLDAAKRELAEETGYGAEDWQFLGSYTVHGNLGAGKGHFYRAENARKIFLPQSGDLEEMTILCLDPIELKKAVRKGAVCLLNHIAGLGLAKLL